MNRLAIVAGGIAGTALRMGAGGGRWPTFAVNVAGAAVLGYVVTRWPGPWSPPVRFVAVGLLGALTTFSTLAFQVWQLADGGRVAAAVGYGAVSMAAGLVAFALGTRLD